MDAKEKNQILFAQVVLMFHGLAMSQMGKIKNPMTDKVERDLAGAQGTIDILDMMKEKTKGNLNQEEEHFLTNMLQELKLNYVDEAAKPNPPPAPDEKGTT